MSFELERRMMGIREKNREEYKIEERGDKERG
jgi:hypothetical protein